MANEYAPLATLKEFLGIGATDTSRDTLLALALGAASRKIDAYTGRRFWYDAGVSVRTFDTAGRTVGTTLLVDDIGTATGLIVETGWGASWSTVAAADVSVSPSNATASLAPYTALVRAAGWPAYPATVRVTARWGWTEIPDDVRLACLILAARLFKRKDSPEGVLGSSDWGTVRVSRMDPDVAGLLGRYVIVSIG